jgi:hypothetical protein
MDEQQEKLLAQLYQKYQRAKQKQAIEQLERVLFHGVLPGVPAPSPAPPDAIGNWPKADRIKFLRTLPVCVQELYGLNPVYDDSAPNRPLASPESPFLAESQ